MRKVISFVIDKGFDIVFHTLTKGGAMITVLIAWLEKLPLTYIWLFFMVAVLISLMIKNQRGAGKNIKLTSDNVAPDEMFFKLKIEKDDVYRNTDAVNIRNYKLLFKGDKKLLILFEFFHDTTHDMYRFDIDGYKEGDRNSIGNIFHKDIYENKGINIIEFTFKEYKFSDIDYLEIKWCKHEPKKSPRTR